MIWYVGDIHGRVDDLVKLDQAAVKAGVDTIVQVGDFGILWPGTQCSIVKYFQKRARQNRPGPRWLTCGGNHDNWQKFFELAAEQGEPDLVELAPGCYYVQRGCVCEIDRVSHIFFGGAESIDKHNRTEGKSWWREETPSYGEFYNFAANLEDEAPEVVVTHDAPTRVPVCKDDRDTAPTPRNLENILKVGEHKPARWYFGHHHILDSWDISGIKFYCCGFHGEHAQE